MDNERIFKNQLFGFDKKDVLDYIDATNRTAMEAEQNLNNRVNALSEERQSLRTQLDEFETKMQLLEKRIEDEKNVIDQLTGKVSELNDIIRQKNDIIDRKNREFEMELAEKKRLRNAAFELEEKSKKYDEVATRIGNVMLEAEKNAVTIIDRAKNKAESLDLDTKTAAETFDNDLDELKKNISDLKTSLHTTMTTIEIQLDTLNNSIEIAKSKLSAYIPEDKMQKPNIILQMQNNHSEQIPREDVANFF